MLLYRVAHLNVATGAYTKFDRPEPLEIFVSPLQRKVSRRQQEHCTAVEVLKQRLLQLTPIQSGRH
jgi:hypothetical protein